MNQKLRMKYGKYVKCKKKILCKILECFAER